MLKLGPLCPTKTNSKAPTFTEPETRSPYIAVNLNASNVISSTPAKSSVPSSAINFPIKMETLNPKVSHKSIPRSLNPKCSSPYNFLTEVSSFMAASGWSRALGNIRNAGVAFRASDVGFGVLGSRGLKKGSAQMMIQSQG